MPSEENNVVLVTGGSGGLGSAICHRLAELKFRVVLNYNEGKERAEAVCDAIKQRSLPTPLCIRADVTDPDQVSQMVRCARDEFGAIDIIINNAGIRYDRLFLLSSQDAWWRVIHTNLGGTVNCCRAVLPLMMSRRSGKIINISSISGHRGVAGQTAYSASKAALIGFSKAIAREVAGYGISVNCISPGLLDTDMRRDLKSEVVDRYIATTPLGRLGSPDEVAEIVALLSSNRANYLFGQNIIVDGGATM